MEVDWGGGEGWGEGKGRRRKREMKKKEDKSEKISQRIGKMWGLSGFYFFGFYTRFPIHLFAIYPSPPSPRPTPHTHPPTFRHSPFLNPNSNPIALGARNFLARFLDRLEDGLVPDAAGVHVRGLVLERDVVR